MMPRLSPVYIVWFCQLGVYDHLQLLTHFVTLFVSLGNFQMPLKLFQRPLSLHRGAEHPDPEIDLTILLDGLDNENGRMNF